MVKKERYGEWRKNSICSIKTENLTHALKYAYDGDAWNFISLEIPGFCVVFKSD